MAKDNNFQYFFLF